MKKELIKNMVSLIVGEALLEFIEDTTSPKIVNDLREKYSEKILSAIDSMQKEPVSGTLEKAARKYAGIPEDSPHDLKYCVQDKKAKYDAVLYGANLQKQQMIAKAIDGQLENGEDYLRIKCLSMSCQPQDDGKLVKLIIFKED